MPWTLGATVTVLAGLALTGQADATVINSFYNTGVDNSHATLANGAADQHYSLAATPDGSKPGVRAANSANGFPIPPWLADDSKSTWIGPNTDAALDGGTGNYDYQTTFDLTGYNAASAVLSGAWSTDNFGMDILLNGVSTKSTSADFKYFTGFTLQSGFVAGVNTIDFIVNNVSGPTGLRVEGTLTASLPEPASLAVLMVGLTAIGLKRKRGAC